MGRFKYLFILLLAMKDYSEIEDFVKEKLEDVLYGDVEVFDLFDSPMMKEFYKNTPNPDLFKTTVDSIGEFLNMRGGAEASFCLKVIETLSQESVKLMANRFKNDKSVQEAISSVVKGSLDCIFADEPQEIYPRELNKYLPIIKPWISYVTDSEITEQTKDNLENSLDSLRWDLEDKSDGEYSEYTKECIENLSKSISIRLKFLEDVLEKDNYNKYIIQELSKEYSNELEYINNFSKKWSNDLEYVDDY